jgi:hypothetical protein
MRLRFFILFCLFICLELLTKSSQHKTWESEHGPNVIISDLHVGTTSWQIAVLNAIGCSVEAYSLSKHTHYVAGNSLFLKDSLFVNIGLWSKEKVCKEFIKNKRWAHLTHAVCSFPPSYIINLEKLPSQITLLLNIGHRIHIHLKPDQMINFTQRIIKMAQDPRYIIAVMSEYDFHYTRYYTGIDLLRLPVISQHISQKLREASYAPNNRIVLIGPSHNTDRIIGFDNDLNSLNCLSAEFAARYGLEPYTFNYIKSLYPHDQATMEKLAQHPAVLMSPYAAFSISMVELYHLNIPFFVPDDSLLINAMEDVRLYPNYQNKDTIAYLEQAYPVSRSKYSYSPNDESIDAQRYWLKFMFFNQVKHAQHWKDPEDLFRKLYFNDLRQLHDDMQLENAELFNEQLKLWASIFGKVY